MMPIEIRDFEHDLAGEGRDPRGFSEGRKSPDTQKWLALR